MKTKVREKILITGASGFFGSHLVKRLKKEGNDIYTDKFDLTNGKKVRKTIAKINPSVVYHMGAIVDLSRNFETAKKCFDINIGGTLNLLDALKNISPCRFIYTSTVEVYGSNPLPYREDQLPDPPSPYSISKVASESLIKLYAQERGYEYFIFRIGTAYGSQQPSFRLIPHIIIRALQNKDIELNSGIKKRDYIDIDDVILALEMSIDKNVKKTNEILNLGGGESYMLKDLVNIILDITKSKSKVKYGVFADRSLEAEEWLLDNSKAYKVLGWKPKTSLRNGLGKMITYYKSHLSDYI